MAWNSLPKGAVARGVKFAYNNKFVNWYRYFAYTYGWSGREYGLLYHDQCFEPAPEIQEALRRLNLKEPYEFDQRKIRLMRATNLATNNERLPKEQWTKWEDETFYLKPYIDEVEAEKKDRASTSGYVPRYEAKLP